MVRKVIIDAVKAQVLVSYAVMFSSSVVVAVCAAVGNVEHSIMNTISRNMAK